MIHPIVQSKVAPSLFLFIFIALFIAHISKLKELNCIAPELRVQKSSLLDLEVRTTFKQNKSRIQIIGIIWIFSIITLTFYLQLTGEPLVMSNNQQSAAQNRSICPRKDPYQNNASYMDNLNSSDVKPGLIFDYLSKCRPFNVSFPPASSAARYAILITGASRTFGQVWPSILRTWLSESNADLYFVINIPESPTPWDCLQFLPVFMHPGLRYFGIYLHNHTELVNRTEAKFGKLGFEPTWSSRFIIDQTFYLKLGWDALISCLFRWNMPDYDMIIRLRPDAYYPDPDRVMRLDFLHGRMMTIPAEKGRYLTPKYLGYGSITDQLGIADMRGARIAFTLYDRIMNLSKTTEWGPEKLTEANLVLFGVAHQHFEDLYSHIGEDDCLLVRNAGGPSFEASAARNTWAQEHFNSDGFHFCLLRLDGVCELACLGAKGTRLKNALILIDYAPIGF